MKQEPIIFRQGEENGIVVERDYFEHSIMLNQYQQAIDIFNRQWKQQTAIIEDLKKSSGRNNDIWIDNKFSNIIAFCGDRGEGKSSCMASFATMLTDGEVRKAAYDAKRKILVEDKQTQEKKDGYQKLFNGLDDLLTTDKIEWLDVIDPSFFDDQHNLLELLLGRICIKAQDKCKQECEKDGSNVCKHRQLMEQLQRVKKCISVMTPKKDKPLYDAIEEISDLAAGMQLKTELQTLFKCYLNFVGKECLLICIDDLDLNIAEGYEMAEMIRKYLINPYCIVLVSVKVEQLIDVIANAHKREAPMTSEKNQQMALKYVAKLLPRGNRVLMPVAEDFCERDLQIADVDGKINTEEPIYTVKEKVVQMIFQKTGYVFYNTQHQSPIVPRNLRSLRHLLGLLCTLPDARDENWDDDETGREAFKDYFFGTWATQNLSDRDYGFVQQLANYDDLSTFNAFVVEHFAKRIKEDAKIEIETTDINEDYAKLYLSITSNKNTATNISFGDVMYILWLINGISLNLDIQKLIFFIKTVYSMRLYACYNVISLGEEQLYPETPNVEKVVHIHKADTQYEHVNQLQKLVNGSYFTYPQGRLLPRNTEMDAYRDRKAINLNYFEGTFKLLKNNRLLTGDDYIFALNLCELLALCVSRTIQKEETQTDRGYNRISKTPTFLGPLSTDANYVMFDFLHPFYAVSNIKYAYGRLDGVIAAANKLESFSLYDTALHNENSLLCQFLSLKQDCTDNFKQLHHLISDAVIRISDVQWSIYDELLQRNHFLRKGADNIIIAKSYEYIQNLNIKLYELIRKDSSKNNAHILNFEFLAILSSFIKGIGAETFQKLFYISKDELLQQDLARFNRQILSALAMVLTWPLKGKDVIKFISDNSDLKSKQKTSFTGQLKRIFEKERNYTREQVIQKMDEIIKVYLIAKSK